MTTTQTKDGAPKKPAKGQAARAQRVALARRRARRRLLGRTSLIAVAGLAVLMAIFASAGGGAKGGSGPRFDVGDPGPGQQAPAFRLASTSGGDWDLRSAQGKTVLLYFQEGLMCQPCWDQISAIEKQMDQFRALGIDELVSITTDDLRLVRQKVEDEGIRSPVLSDPELSLAPTYNANRYGMMGLSRYGHTFIVVGPDGRIRWRADYGGAPEYTMYVKPSHLLDDLRAGLNPA